MKKKTIGLIVIAILLVFNISERGYADLNDGLVAYYPFNGNANDESGNGNNGTVFGNPLYESGINGKSIHFNTNSEDDYIQVSGLSVDLKPITIVAWVKPDYRYDWNNGLQSYESKYPNNVISGDKAGYGGYGFGLNYRSDVEQLEFQIESHDGSAHQSIELLDYDPSLFYFIATVYDVNEVRIYRGSSAGQALLTSVLSNDGSLDGNKDYVLIGRHNFDTNWKTKNAFKGRIDEIRIYNRAISYNEIIELYHVVFNFVIDQHPMSGPPGTTFVQWGTGFTPNTTATLHFKKPDGTEYDTQTQAVDAIGHFEISYTAPWDKPPGTYTWWAIDGGTGNKKSNEVSYEVTPLSANVTIQKINPQSDKSFYDNFFPSPNPDKLITGGTECKSIVADGESRILLRIVSNTPGQAAIKEKDTNTTQNGNLSTLGQYLNSAGASSVSVQLEPHGNQYVGFAVYRAPIDFYPNQDNQLTKTIKLEVSYTGGSADVEITIRRPPVFISHGLWSSGWGNDEIETFRNTLWNSFDHGSEDINEYIWLNDGYSVHADSVFIGSNKTRSNLREYLNYLRRKQIIVTQVDYLGHSMGGQWGRLVEQRYSKDKLTYDKGYLHKLITLDTPHVGSFLADILQFTLDNSEHIQIFNAPNAKEYLCWISQDFCKPVCLGAIKNLTSYETIDNLNEITVPAHAIIGNKPIDTACALLSISSYVSGGTAAAPIVKTLKITEKILKKIDPDYGCENWFNKFDFNSDTDLIVGLYSQKGGLTGSQLSPFDHQHTASFNSNVNTRFFDLLKKSVNDIAFAKGFPASSTVFIGQNHLTMKSDMQHLSIPENQTSLGEIQFIKPVNAATVQPGDKLDVELSLTGSLTLKNMMITAAGADMVEIVNPPYTTTLTVPGDSYGSFTIFVLGEGTDGNLYSASVSLSVNNAAVLQKVDVSPQSIYLNLGQEMDISVTGTYSDGSIRNLSSKTYGTTYKSSDETIVSISENGKVTPHAVGTGYILVSPSLSQAVTVRVEIVSTYVGSQLVVTPSAHNPASSSGTIAFTVSNTGMEVMPWTAAVTAGGSWLKIVSGSSGMDTGTINCAFDANTTTSSRTGTIRVTATGATGSPKDVTVTQAAPTAKPVISGTVKTGTGTTLSGVTITFSNSGGTAVTDTAGNYTIAVPVNYSGTATPSKTGYTFSPASKTYTNVTANQTGQNYIATVQTTSRQQFWGIWSDGVYAWDKTTGKWTKMASTSNAVMIAAGKIDSDGIDDLIGVWTSGLYVKLSSNGQWLKLSTTLPTWIAAGDLNNDGRDDVIASWKNDGVYYRDSANGKWLKVSAAAKQLAAGNIGGVRDDLAGVWSDGLWVRYSADASWKKIDPGIPLWITAGDISGDKRADIVGSYSTGTWYRNSVSGAWTKITTSAEQLTTGDLDGDGRDDIVGIWPNGVYVRYGATSQWQFITPSKPKWITTGRMAEALQTAGLLDDPSESTDENGMVDLSQEGPDGMMPDRHFLDGEGPMPAE